MPVTKESIFAHRPKLTPVEVPEWGGTLYVRVMSGTERDAFEVETYTVNGKSVAVNRANLRARLLVRCVCDEQGNRLFADADADALGSQPADVIDRVFTVAQKANGMTAADVEELAKNSDACPNDGSGST